MRIRRPIVVLVVAFSVSAFIALASPSPQWKPSKSDADITAIGHRKIVRGTNIYSLEKEKALGNQLAKQFERSAKFVDDPEIVGYVDRVGQNVARNSDARMPVTFRVIDTETVGAFTLPDGHQYVGRGLLLQLGGEAELAGVLARGIAHTALRSATKQATEGEITQLAGIPVFTPNGVPVPSGNTPLQAGAMLTLIKVEREDELAADYFGLQYVYVTGYDPEPYTRLIERGVWPKVSPGKTVPKELSSFPPVGDRLKAMRKEIAEILPKRSDAVVSTPEFDAFKERVRAWKPGQPESKQPDGNH
jgi:predicted Zn-dependent protease